MTTPTLPEPRDRITSGINRSRLRLEARRGARPFVVIVIGALFSIAAWSVIVKNVGRHAYADTQTVGFEVSEATAVVGGGRQEVRFKGVPVGVIDAVELRDGRPYITAKIYREYLPVYRDAKVNLRPTTALEDMYLDIVDRGNAAAGEASADRPIPPSNVRTGVQPEEVLQAFEPDVRKNLAHLLDDLGRGLGGRGDELRAAFVELTPLLMTADRLSKQLVRREKLTRGVVSDTASITEELGRRDTTLRTLVTDAGSSLRTLQAKSPELDATLRELPRTLALADATFTDVRTALPDVDHALIALRPVADKLPKGLKDLRELNTAAKPAVLALGTPVRRLSALSLHLGPVARQLQSIATALRPQVGAIDHATRVIAGCSAAIQGFFQWTPSVMKMGDARGAVVRGQAVVGLSSTAAAQDPAVSVTKSCAPGAPVVGGPGTGGTLQPQGGKR